MVNSADQLKKYKQIKKKLEKKFPKGTTGYEGFTIDISYGGNKEPDIKRVSLGGISDSTGKKSNEFLKLLMESVDDQIDFWARTVLQDIKNLEEALKE